MGLNHKKNANLQMVVLNLLITQISEGSWESLPTAAHKNLGVFHPGNILSPAFSAVSSDIFQGGRIHTQGL